VDKRSFFIAAMKAGRYLDLPWITRCFSVTYNAENPDLSKMSTYDIHRDDSGYYFMTAEGALERIDTDPKKPIYLPTDRIDVGPGDIPNLNEQVNTRVGTFLGNYIMLVYPFGAKIPYINNAIRVKQIESIILENFVDGPDIGAKAPTTQFYVSDYLKFCEAASFLMNTASLFVWAATKKVLLPPPGIVEYRTKLLAENAGHLHELATIAKIGQLLEEYDAAWLKGDPGGENFVTAGKARNVIRKKKFLTYGAEQGFETGGVNATLIPKSLHEGWDLNYFPLMNDSLRAGVFGRGYETQLGGVTVKWLYRASSNCAITMDDCGSTIGSEMVLVKELVPFFKGMTIIDGETQAKLVDVDQAGPYLGKNIMLRNPMYCRLKYTDYCRVCVGDKLAVNPYGLATATNDYGAVFLALFMSKMHGKALKNVRLEFDEVIL
jgi:hypothetical protein